MKIWVLQVGPGSSCQECLFSFQQKNLTMHFNLIFSMVLVLTTDWYLWVFLLWVSYWLGGGGRAWGRWGKQCLKHITLICKINIRIFFLMEAVRRLSALLEKICQALCCCKNNDKNRFLPAQLLKKKTETKWTTSTLCFCMFLMQTCLLCTFFLLACLRGNFFLFAPF